MPSPAPIPLLLWQGAGQTLLARRAAESDPGRCQKGFKWEYNGKPPKDGGAGTDDVEAGAPGGAPEE